MSKAIRYALAGVVCITLLSATAIAGVNAGPSKRTQPQTQNKKTAAPAKSSDKNKAASNTRHKSKLSKAAFWRKNNGKNNVKSTKTAASAKNKSTKTATKTAQSKPAKSAQMKGTTAKTKPAKTTKVKTASTQAKPRKAAQVKTVSVKSKAAKTSSTPSSNQGIKAGAKKTTASSKTKPQSKVKS